MRHTFIVAGIIMMIAVIATPAYAEPTIFGPTGLIIAPTADLTPADHAWMAINFFDNEGSAIWTANVTGAILENFEVSIGAVHPDVGDDGITFSGKWLFLPAGETWPGVATGVTLTDVAGTNSTMLYAVASKFLYFGDNAEENASFHAGGAFVKTGKNEDFEYFGGLDLELVKNLILIGEYYSDEDSIYSGFSYGARYYLTHEFTIQAGVIDGDLTFSACYIF